MPIYEDQLTRYTRPASDTEEQKCETSSSLVRRALRESADMSGRSYQVIPQGSYNNNTNVRLNSDVDICVAFDDVFMDNYSEAYGWNRERLGITNSSHNFHQDRQLLGNALRNFFGSLYINEGSKAFEVSRNTANHVATDVVATWRYRFYRSPNQLTLPTLTEGVTFWTPSGNQIINFPEQHYINGINKNNRTGRAFKRAVRIVKRIRYDLEAKGIYQASQVSSYEIECAMYNISDYEFIRYQDWRSTIQNILDLLIHILENVQANDWEEVNGIKWMFKSNFVQSPRWETASLLQFLRLARSEVG